MNPASPAPAAPRVAAFDVADRPETEDAPAPEEEEPEAERVSSAAAPPSPPVPAPTLIGAGWPVPPIPVIPAVTSPPVPDARPAAPPAPKKRPSGGDQGPDTWHARVLGRLNAVKTYPSSARARRQQGTVMVRFTVDRKGQVLHVALQKTSGFAPLDREALALPKRTSPLPPPPEDVAGETIELSVPVEFYF
ncbi:MAG TPA: energy transducer TonB [Novosphingobium sp.]|nr:energy transducer TonB [Novosphingobium sp.]